MAYLTWNEFRALHPGTARNEISDLWSQYKDNEYEPPSSNPEDPPEPFDEEQFEVALAEEESEEEGVEDLDPSDVRNITQHLIDDEATEEEVEESDDDAGDVVTGKDGEESEPPEPEQEPEPTRKELLQQFADTYNEAFNNRLLTKEEKNVILRRLYALADKTIGVPQYSCDPTHGWQLWIGPEPASLLVNETNGVAFCISRAWWHHHYLGAALCAERVCDSQSQVDSIREGFAKREKLVYRVPVPGYEIMLPHSRLEIWNTASGSWD